MSPQIQSAALNSRYGEEYFKYQFEIGRFGGWANVTKFAQYVKPDMRVLDFGCGCGYLLAHLACKEKLGIEINSFARAKAKEAGISTVACTDEVEDGWADLIISNHVLEHCQHPLPELERLFPKLAPNGMVVFVVPCEAIKNRYKATDPDHELYSWGPMALANLFSDAGFTVIESKAYIHCWPPRFIPRLLRSLGGRWLFELGCRLYGGMTYLNLTPASLGQVRLVARAK